MIDEGATLAASFVERALPKIDLTHEMEADTGAIMQKGVHKVSCVRLGLAYGSVLLGCAPPCCAVDGDW